MSDPAATPLDLARGAIVGQILAFARGRAREGHEGLAARVERELDLAGEAAVRSLVERLFVGDVPFGYHPPEAIPRRVHHLLAELMLEPGSGWAGEGPPDAPPEGAVVIAANHLSYADANLLAILLEQIGWGALVERLTVIAGPKVYSELVRHFMSLCFGTVKTPQSSALATEDAAMSAREVARVARETIQVAHERLQCGDALLVFVEGTRSRSGGMARALPAVGRYLEPPTGKVMPVAIW
ncbi:MAG: 1-acyl-sn-glycerol-3-phosphate acyltransferase, partial [Deltaproteobacteria bacterium]|nr:1-acyl-sn-glycerol-3-phosphate acyltransferase [Deltaproteobacteria bacterium]